MDLFAISDLQRFSGIKAHTIRIWEQRYNALQPERSEGNTRYYNGSQLRRLLNIVSLLGIGYKISELSKMPDKKMNEILTELAKQSTGQDPVYEYFISQMVRAGLEFNEEHLEKIFSSCLLRFGLKDAYIYVLYPMLLRVGLMWASDIMTPAQEHFISNLVRQKLLAGIDALPPAANSADSWLLFLPEDEFHEIGLLFSSFLIRQSGKKVIYLGASCSLETLKTAVKTTQPAHLLLFMSHYDDPANTQQYMNRLMQAFPAVDINIAGNEKLISAIEKRKKLHWIKSSQALEQKLNSVVV